MDLWGIMINQLWGVGVVTLNEPVHDASRILPVLLIRRRNRSLCAPTWVNPINKNITRQCFFFFFLAIPTII